jgi:hypothetical protein
MTDLSKLTEIITTTLEDHNPSSTRRERQETAELAERIADYVSDTYLTGKLAFGLNHLADILREAAVTQAIAEAAAGL